MVALPTMESFGLLKYWRCGAAAIRSSVAITADFATAVLRPSSATAVDEEEDDDDEGPFFDLEFTAFPVAGVSGLTSDGEADDGQFNLELSSVGGSGLRTRSFSSPIAASDSDTKPYFPVASLLKSATKFRVFLLGLRKSKPTAAAPSANASPKQQQQSRFFVKFKVEEVPIVSLFTRDNSFRNISDCRAAKPHQENSLSAAISRELMQKYVRMIKPIYVRVSRRPSEVVRLREDGGGRGAGKGGRLSAGLTAAGKRVGKGRSASTAAAAAQRRDESVQELDDVIQSAIAHCKRSFAAHEEGAQASSQPATASNPPPI